MPHYPTSYYGVNIGTSYNNVVTRRLAVKDRVAFQQSPRFGGQWMEPKGAQQPYNSTVQEAVVACQQMINECNLIAPLMPDMGIPVILSTVGVATNQLYNAQGVAVSYIGGLTTTLALASGNFVDGVGYSTGLRVAFFGLSTGSMNGVYTLSQNAGVYSFNRASDLTWWWQFVKPKAYLVTGGNTNKATVLSLQTDLWELGNTSSIAYGTSVATQALAIASTSGTTITLTATNYGPNVPSGTNANLGAGAGNTSDIFPGFNPLLVLNTGEYDFLGNDSHTKLVYLKNRARRLAYTIFKMRENYTPGVSQYGQNVVLPIGVANTANNIGFSTLNDLPKGSRYPSGFNRGF